MTVSLRSFAVVVVPFPFSDTPEVIKPRPALVLSTEAHRRTGQVIVAMITSSEAAWSGDVNISNWKAIGLPKPSKIRMAKIATFDASAVRKLLGRVDEEARIEVKAHLHEFLDC